MSCFCHIFCHLCWMFTLKMAKFQTVKFISKENFKSTGCCYQGAE